MKYFYNAKISLYKSIKKYKTKKSIVLYYKQYRELKYIVNINGK